MKILVSLGFFDDSGEGQLLGVDLATGRSDVLLSYLPPPMLHVPTRGFTGACLSEDGDAVFVAGHAAVFRISTRSFTVDGILHMPSFNDLHHVAAGGGRIYVANTGSDSVDVFSRAGRFVGSYLLTPGWVLASKMQGHAPAATFDVLHAGWELETSAGVKWLDSVQSSDLIADDDGYHTAPAMRATTAYWQGKLPDRLHPNHTCLLSNQTLVTCLQDGSIRDLRTLQIVHQQAGSYPHDGLVADDRFFFTTIDGKLQALPLAKGELVQQSDKSTISKCDSATAPQSWDIFEQTGKYGWCRGLLLQPGPNGMTAAVGLSEVRRGRMPRYTWCARSFEGSKTGVVWLDLATGRQLAWVDLSNAARHSKLYSLLPWCES